MVGKRKEKRTVNEVLEQTTLLRSLIFEMKMPKISYEDRAILIKRALKLEKRTGEKGTASIELAKKIGIGDKKELYRCMNYLNINDNTKKLVRDGKISSEKVARVFYSLKDKSREDEVMKRVIRGNLPTFKAEKLVAEINNPSKILEHLKRDIDVFFETVESYKKRIKGFDSKDKVAIQSLLKGMEDKLKLYREEVL